MGSRYSRRYPRRRRFHMGRLCLLIGIGIVIIAIIILIICALAGAFSGTGSSNPTPSPSPSAVASVQPSPTPSPTSTPSNTSFLDNAAFLGNSMIDDLDTYGVLGDADVFARTNLTVSTVFNTPTIKGSVPIIEEIKGKDYDRVYLLFGHNELGWPKAETFIKKYGEIIDTVNTELPDATVYVQSILPVSKAVSDKNKDNTNKDRIEEYNELLQELAEEKKAVYLDVGSVMRDEDGYMIEGASADGAHPNVQYSKLWVEYLGKHADDGKTSGASPTPTTKSTAKASATPNSSAKASSTPKESASS